MTVLQLLALGLKLLALGLKLLALGLKLLANCTSATPPARSLSQTAIAPIAGSQRQFAKVHWTGVPTGSAIR